MNGCVVATALKMMTESVYLVRCVTVWVCRYLEASAVIVFRNASSPDVSDLLETKQPSHTECIDRRHCDSL